MGKFFGKTAELKIQVNSTDLTIGVVQSVELSQNKEYADARGSGSGKRQARGLTEFEYDVSAEIIEYDQETIAEVMGLDTATTGGQTKDNVTNPVTVKLAGSYEDESGNIVNFETFEMNPESVDWGGSHDEFIPLVIEGTASDIDISSGAISL